MIELQSHPRNYKKHPETQLVKLRESLKRFGQVKPILIQMQPGDHRFVIVAGHGVFEAAEDLGWEHIAASLAPRYWTPSDALAYLIADNETSNDAEINELMLAELLEESRNCGYDLAALGSSEAQLAALLEKLTQEQLTSGNTQPLPNLDEIADDESPLDVGSTTCPNCGHIF